MWKSFRRNHFHVRVQQWPSWSWWVVCCLFLFSFFRTLFHSLLRCVSWLGLVVSARKLQITVRKMRASGQPARGANSPDFGLALVVRDGYGGHSHRICILAGRKEEGTKIKPFPLQPVPRPCAFVYILGPELGHMATLSCKDGRVPSRKWEFY